LPKDIRTCWKHVSKVYSFVDFTFVEFYFCWFFVSFVDYSEIL
jgi:hypothetical protein